MMNRKAMGALVMLLVVGAGIGCGSGSAGDAEGWARGEVSVDDETYGVAAVSMELGFDDGSYYNIAGNPSPDPGEDCVPGLGGGMMLYGPLPSGVSGPEDLPGKRLQVEFSGDGDDANLCFLGMNGLMGAESAWVTIDAVDGDRIEFTMAGSFRLYDGDGGSGGVSRASARGSAQLTEVWR